MKCKTCGHTKFRRDIKNAVSDLSCENCGRVAEENPIVSELQFGESSSGAATVNGSFIRHDQTSASSSLKSRELTLQNAKRKINALASALGVPSHIAEAAHKWYNLALTMNFVKGRKSQNVIASCLYIACRKEKTHHMLINFSSKLQVSVFSIGSTFLKMVKALNVTSLPLADPSLFIQHFADKLNFGGAKIKVIRDATKLAQRMSYDWIYEGRRPAGIAGACVLLAARMNNFRRSHEEIVALAHVGEDTLQKRLNEFKKTKSSSMSINEFRNTENKDIENTLPPAYLKGRNKTLTALGKKNKRLSKVGVSLITRVLNVEVSGSQIKDEIRNIMSAVKAITEDNQPKKKRKVIKKSSEEQEESEAIHLKGNRKGIAESDDEDEYEDEDSEGKAKSEGTSRNANQDSNANNRYFELLKNMSDFEDDDDEVDGPDIPNQQEEEQLKIIDANRPRNLVANLPRSSDVLATVPDGETFSDIDDDELDDFILTEEESLLKERIFVNLNADYLLEMAEKKLKQESDELSGHTSKPTRRKRRNTNGQGHHGGVSGTEFAGIMDDAANDATNRAINGAIKQLGEKSEGFKIPGSVPVIRAKPSTKLNYLKIDDLDLFNE